MAGIYIVLNILDGNTPDPADRVGKVFINHFLADTDGFENLGALIRLDGGNTHLGSNFYNAVNDGLIIVIHCRIVIFFQHACIDELMDGIQCKVRIDSTCAVAQQGGKMMHFSRFPCLKDQSKGRSSLGFHEILVHCGDSKQ